MNTFLLAVALLTLGCQISPVITDPGEGRNDRYLDCRRAAHDYCEQAADGADSRACAARATYDCVSSPRH